MRIITIALLCTLTYGCSSNQLKDEEVVHNVSDQQGGTPLFLAMMKDDKSAANDYISDSKYINTSRSDGVSPLMLASIKGFNNLAANLIAMEADIDAVTILGKYGTTVGMTALMFSAESGNASLTELLVSKNADIHLQDENGMTALMYAVTSKNLETVMVLGEAGASYYHVTNKKGHTAATIAKLMKLNEIFTYLQKKNSEAVKKQFLN